jgi:hypothetical protein
MKHTLELFATKEEVQLAHESLAMVQYLFLNRQNRSQFVCITLLSVYLGEHDAEPLDWDRQELRKDVCRRLERHIHDTKIYPYSTVESFIAHRDGHDEPNEVDQEYARGFRLSMLDELLKELA